MVDDLFEMLLADEGFGIDLADVLGARGADCGPAVFAEDFDAAYRGVVAWGLGGDGEDFVASEFRHADG